MQANDPVEPVLFPASWPERSTAFCAPLLPESLLPVPWLAFRVGADGDAALVSSDDVHGADARKRLRKAAMRHLRGRRERPQWQRREVLPALLERRGDEFTASDVIDAAVLREAQEQLGSDRLLVAIPDRHSMVVGVAGCQRSLNQLAAIARDGYTDADDDLVTPLLFRSRDGHLRKAMALGDTVALLESEVAEVAA